MRAEQSPARALRIFRRPDAFRAGDVLIAATRPYGAYAARMVEKKLGAAVSWIKCGPEIDFRASATARATISMRADASSSAGMAAIVYAEKARRICHQLVECTYFRHIRSSAPGGVSSRTASILPRCLRPSAPCILTADSEARCWHMSTQEKE